MKYKDYIRSSISNRTFFKSFIATEMHLCVLRNVCVHNQKDGVIKHFGF